MPLTLTQFLDAVGGPPVGDTGIVWTRPEDTEVTVSAATLAAVQRQAKADAATIKALRREKFALAVTLREFLTRERMIGNDINAEWRAADKLVNAAMQTTEGR